MIKPWIKAFPFYSLFSDDSNFFPSSPIWTQSDWPARPPSLLAGSLADGLKRQMLNWAWVELCSSRVWQYSIRLAHTWYREKHLSGHWQQITVDTSHQHFIRAEIHAWINAAKLDRPVAEPPPFPLSRLGNLQVLSSRPASTTCPCHFQPGVQAMTDKDA